MGAQSSTHSVVPLLPGNYSELSTEDVAAQIRDLGKAYEGYAHKAIENGFDGVFLQNEVTAEDLPDVFQDLGVTSAMHQKKLAALFRSFKAKIDGLPLSEKPLKKFGGFLSHFKQECGTEARLVANEMKTLQPELNLFLDSDDLFDLRSLLEDVKQSDRFILFQSAGVLTRPWCLMEIVTAISSQVPIVCINVLGPNRYDYSSALTYMTHLDTELDRANPGASKLLEDNGVSLTNAAYMLSNTIPNCISIDFNPHGSSNNITAALMDLKEALNNAAAHPISIPKEDWLAKRGAPPRDGRRHGRQAKQHGSGEGNSGGGAEDQKASVPETVPELPDAFCVRDVDLMQLKSALLSGSGGDGDGDGPSNGTAITSGTRQSLRQSQSKKVGAHGMGGLGKTTTAASLVHDEEILSSFQAIVWVSVGQEPNLLTLADSIHHQLTKQGLPEEAKDERDALVALREAAKGKVVLLVLDDVWNPSHEKPLNCIDTATSSRLLVTTRIRGLMKNAQEISMGILSDDEALAMLLKYAKVEALEKSSTEYARAVEVVSLCGKLPLTIAIAGGMVASSSQGFTEDMVAMMKTDMGKEMRDESGITVEERIIASSIKMIGKHSDSATIESTFRHFAVFAEDLPVPKAVFDVISPMLVPRSSSRAASSTKVSSCIAVLMSQNLLKGSLAMRDGVFMHDIVRDYVIALLSEAQLRAKQAQMVEMLLLARPAEGFKDVLNTSPGNFDGYVARNLAHHMRGSLSEGETPSYEWLAHRDNVVVKSAALALGRDAMIAQIASAEASLDLLLAARLAWALVTSHMMKKDDEIDLAYKCVDLMENQSKRRGGYGRDEEASRRFHMAALHFAFKFDVGSERYFRAKAQGKRLTSPPQSLSARIGGCILGAIVSPGCLKCLVSCVGTKNKEKETFEFARFKGGLELWRGFDRLGLTGGDAGKWPSPTEDDRRAALSIFSISKSYYMQALNVSDTQINTHFVYLLNNTVDGAFIVPMFNLWEDPDSVSVSEAQLVEAISSYDFARYHPIYSSTGSKADPFFFGCFNLKLVLFWGNLASLSVWHRKACATFRELDLANTRDFRIFQAEIGPMACMLPIFVMINRMDLLSDVMDSFGVDCRDDSTFQSIVAFSMTLLPKVNGAEDIYWIWKLLAFLAMAQETDDVSDVTWMPSPIVLAEMGKNWIYRNGGALDVLYLGCRTYMKLNRDDDAYQLASIVVSPEQQTIKKTELVNCFTVLGEIAAKRGKLDEAESHFANALEEAKLSRLPMLEVLAAQRWKKRLWSPNGRDASGAEATIDRACGKMKKSLDDLASVLL